MPRHDDIFDFSPAALERTQRASFNGASIFYVGTEEPGIVYFWGLEVEPHLRGQGRTRPFLTKLNEHCDATGTTRMSRVMSRGDVPFDRLIEFYCSLGFELAGEVEERDGPHPRVWVVRKPRPIEAR